MLSPIDLDSRLKRASRHRDKKDLNKIKGTDSGTFPQINKYVYISKDMARENCSYLINKMKRMLLQHCILQLLYTVAKNEPFSENDLRPCIRNISKRLSLRLSVSTAAHEPSSTLEVFELEKNGNSIHDQYQLL